MASFSIYDLEGGEIMTIITALIMNPENNQEPFVVFGSDSLQVDFLIEGVNKKIVGRYENQQKIFKLQNSLIAFTGNFEEGLIYEILDYLESNTSKESDIFYLIEIAKEFLLSRLVGSTTEYITITIGTIGADGNPKLVNFIINNGNEIEYETKLLELRTGVPFKFMTAGVEVPDELFNSLARELDGEYELKIVTLCLEKFLKEVAKLYPDTCNQNIKIYTLE